MTNKIKVKLNDPKFKEKLFRIIFPVANFRVLYNQHFITLNPDILKIKYLILIKVFLLQIVFAIPVLIYGYYLQRTVLAKNKNKKYGKIKMRDVKKIGVYSPWFDKYAGGGEKVSALIALFFEEKFPDAEIVMIIDDLFGNIIEKPATLDDVFQKYGIKLNRTIFRTYYHGYNNFFHVKYYFNFLKTTLNYDIFVNCFMNLMPSDATLSFHYVHFPLHISSSFSKSLFDKYRNSYHTFITNSEFTNFWTKKWLNVENLKIIYPHIDLPILDGIPDKSNIILTVSRLSDEKKIEIMIEVFQNNIELFVDYEFHIVGSENKKNKYYIESLKAMVKTDKIKFFPNIPAQDLNQKYKEAKIYWNAMGYGYSKNDDPFLFEHFGLTVAEALSFGVVPVVIDYGGPAEIVETGNCGLTWSSKDELVNQTLTLINNEALYKKLQRNAIHFSSKFSRESFFKNFDEVLMNRIYD